MASLRVTSGSLRGRRIPVPPRDVRPTSERARQAFFNIVGPRIEDAKFLDLFSGSGIFSFEAVSRGAASATAIDHDRKNVESVARHANEWNVPVKAIAADVFAGMARLGNEVFDVVYADPPYAFARYDELLAAIDAHVRLSGEAIVAIEHQRHTEPFTIDPPRLRRRRRAEYGEVWITFFGAL